MDGEGIARRRAHQQPNPGTCIAAVDDAGRLFEPALPRDPPAALAEPLDGPTVSAVQRVARERNVSVAIGIAEADAGLVLDEPFDQAQLTDYLSRMLTDASARAAWSRNGLAFAETADLYSMPQHAADVILAEHA